MKENIIEKKPEKKKNILLFIIPIVIIVILITILFLFNNNSKKELPFVEKHNIDILSFDDNYKNPVYFYAQDNMNIETTIDGLKFEDSEALYKFYDYNVSNADDETIYSFKYDFEVPMNASINRQIPYLRYGYGIVFPVFFDYYTGEEYKIRLATVDENHIVSYDMTDEEEDKDEDYTFKYTDIKWDGKTYKIGVRTETYSKWDGLNITTENGQTIYKDTDRATVTVYVKTPKDYDGVMIAIFKPGSYKESHDIQHQQYLKYIELLSDYAVSQVKSEELIEYENNKKRVINLFESSYDKNKKYTKDDFYVIRPEKSN